MTRHHENLELFATLAAVIPSRLDQHLCGIGPVGMTEDGTIVTAEYDDGNSPDGPTMEIMPMLVAFQRAGVLIEMFSSGNFTVSAGNRSVLIENGKVFRG